MLERFRHPVCPANTGPSMITSAAYFLLVALFHGVVAQFAPAAEKQALLELFNATGGPLWRQSSGWNATSDPCADAWFGVTCCADALSAYTPWSKLRGCGGQWRFRGGGGSKRCSAQHASFPGPWEQVQPPQNGAHMVSVCSLELQDNLLAGRLPSSIGSLRKLRNVNLAENSLQGHVPPEVSLLPKLQQVDLFANHFSGLLPSFSGSNASLVFVDVSQNDFSGTLPEEWRHLSAVQELYANGNAMSGILQSWLGALGSLVGLDVSSNALTGVIPSTLGGLQALQLLSVYNNSLRGAIPPELAQLNELYQLDLGSNALDGVIPPAVGRLSNLEGLFLDTNNLMGDIPASLGGLSRLQQLALSRNHLTGQLPAGLANCTELTLLDLDSNALRGGLPVEWAALHKLRQLNLAHNQLTGELPGVLLVNWPSLHFLDVADNQLEGPIPDEIGQLASLQTLYMDENAWSGHIPKTLCSLTGMTSIVLSSASISGAIPQCIGALKQLQVLDLSETQLNGTLPYSMHTLKGLTYLGLERTHLRGDPWGVICELHSLRNLYLMDAFFDAQLPGCIGRLTQLRDLLIADNSFHGSLPTELTQLTLLEKFDAQRNFFVGCLPSGWGNLSSLIFVSVAQNSLNCSIPADIGAAAALEVLDLSSNAFEGAIPASVCDVGGLSSLFLDANHLSGSILPCLASIQSLVVLALSFNSFTGSVPFGLFSLPLLQVFSVGQNKGLFGQLQPQAGGVLFDLPQLYQLDLSDTSLSGSIMSNMEGVPRLQSLNLQRAQFSGPLDSRLAQHCQHLRVLAVDENAFSGRIPGLPESLQTALIAKNNLEGPIPSLGSVVNLTYFFADANPRLSAPPPDDMWRLSRLRVFSAPFCSLHGWVPASLLQLGVWGNSSLVNITLQGNTLHGQLPALCGGGAQLKTHRTGDSTDDAHYTSADIPYTYDYLSDTPSTEPGEGGASLRLLDLSANHLWGEIPPSWEILQDTPLASLKLQLNFLSGSLAPLRGLGNLTELQVLEGSVFSCWSRTWHAFMGRAEHLPEQVLQLDPQASSYQCAWTSWAAPWTALVLLLAVIACSHVATWLLDTRERCHSALTAASELYDRLLCKSGCGQCTCRGFSHCLLSFLQRSAQQHPSTAMGVTVAVFFSCVLLPSYTSTDSLFSDPAEYRFSMVGVTRFPVPWFGSLFFVLASSLWAFSAHQSGALLHCAQSRGYIGCCSAVGEQPRASAGEQTRLLGNAVAAPQYSTSSSAARSSTKSTEVPVQHTSTQVDVGTPMSMTTTAHATPAGGHGDTGSPGLKASCSCSLPAGRAVQCLPLSRWKQRSVIQACMLVAFVLSAAAGDLVLVLVQNNYADWQQRLAGAVDYVELLAAVYRVLLFTLALPFAVVALDMCALDDQEQARRAAEAAAFGRPPGRRRRVSNAPRHRALEESESLRAPAHESTLLPADGIHSSRTFVLCILLFKLAIIPLGVLLIRSEACYADFMPWVPLPTDTVSWEYEVCVVLEPVVQQTNASFALCNNDPSLKAVISREVQVTPPLRWQFSCASAGISLFGPQMALTLAIQGVVYLFLAFVRRACASRIAQSAATASGVACIRETPFVCRRTAGPWEDMEPYLRRRIGMFHATQRAAIISASALYGVGYPLAGVAGGVALVAQAQAQAILRPGMPQNAMHLPVWSALALPLVFCGALWFLFGPISLIADSQMGSILPLLWLLTAAAATAGVATVVKSC